MLSLFMMGIFGAMVGLVAYELVGEVRSGKRKLRDRYHDSD